mgnify:CR=1 FL=1
MGLHDGHRQRKRERFLKQGADGLADHEVLELLLEPELLRLQILLLRLPDMLYHLR